MTRVSFLVVWWLAGIGSTAKAQEGRPLRILGTQIALGEQCDLKVERKGAQPEVVKTGLPVLKYCEFVTWAGTNVVNLTVIRGHYVFLVQARDVSVSGDPTGCVTKYRAVSVARDGRVRVGTRTQRSKACEADHDRAEMEYLSAEIVR